MNGWMDEWMDGWMDGWSYGWMDEWMDGHMNGWMNTSIEICVGKHRVLYRDNTIIFMRNSIYNLTHNTLYYNIVIQSSGFL